MRMRGFVGTVPSPVASSPLMVTIPVAIRPESRVNEYEWFARLDPCLEGLSGRWARVVLRVIQQEDAGAFEVRGLQAFAGVDHDGRASRVLRQCLGDSFPATGIEMRVGKQHDIAIGQLRQRKGLDDFERGKPDR